MTRTPMEMSAYRMARRHGGFAHMPDFWWCNRGSGIRKIRKHVRANWKEYRRQIIESIRPLASP